VPVHFRLDEIEQLARELGFDAHRVDAQRVDVPMADAVLAFCNLEEDDSLVGFDGTPWHFHDEVQFENVDGTYSAWDGPDVLLGLAVGELVVVSHFVAGEVQDRWLSHVDEPLDVKHVWRGEELRVVRLAAKPTRRPSAGGFR
jgi:hypothetical protein